MIRVTGIIRLVMASAVFFQYFRFGYNYFTQGEGNTVAFGILSVLFFPYLFYCVMKGMAELKGQEEFRATFSVLYAIAFQILFLITVIVEVPTEFAKKDYLQVGFTLLYLITFPFALIGDFRSFRNREKV
jgi:uncharacterized protein involved in response to NO